MQEREAKAREIVRQILTESPGTGINSVRKLLNRTYGISCGQAKLVQIVNETRIELGIDGSHQGKRSTPDKDRPRLRCYPSSPPGPLHLHAQKNDGTVAQPGLHFTTRRSLVHLALAEVASKVGRPLHLEAQLRRLTKLSAQGIGTLLADRRISDASVYLSISQSKEDYTKDGTIPPGVSVTFADMHRKCWRLWDKDFHHTILSSSNTGEESTTLDWWVSSQDPGLFEWISSDAGQADNLIPLMAGGGYAFAEPHISPVELLHGVIRNHAIPPKLEIGCWGTSQEALHAFAEWVDSGIVESFDAVFSPAWATLEQTRRDRPTNALRVAKELLPDSTTLAVSGNLHAKYAILTTPGSSILILTSANWQAAAESAEQYVVYTDPAIVEKVREVHARLKDTQMQSVLDIETPRSNDPADQRACDLQTDEGIDYAHAVQRMPVRKIAHRTGRSVPEIQDLLFAVREPLFDRKAVLATELSTLEFLQAALEAKVKAGQVDAIRTAIGIKERRSKYLGLDATDAIRIEEELAKNANILMLCFFDALQPHVGSVRAKELCADARERYNVLSGR